MSDDLKAHPKDVYWLEMYLRTLPHRIRLESRFGGDLGEVIQLIVHYIIKRGRPVKATSLSKWYDLDIREARFLIQHSKMLLRREIQALEGTDLDPYLKNGRIMRLIWPYKRKSDARQEESASGGFGDQHEQHSS